MADVTGVIGTNAVELDNAATENTLKQLLAAVRTLNKTIISSGSSGGGGAAAAGAAAGAALLATNLTKANPIVSALGIALGGLGKTVGLVAGGLGLLIGTFAPATEALVNFGGKLINGQGGLSQFYEALTALPGPLGSIAGLFQKLAEMQEAELEAYRKMSSAGIGFGGQLTQLRQDALSLGLTLTQYADIMKNNSKTFATMGGSANFGAEQFTKLAIMLRNDPVGIQLRALGFDAQQTSEGLASYIAITGGRTKDELKNTREIVDGTGAYLNQLDRLADITGKNREEQEKAHKQAMFEADVQLTMSRMTVEDRKAFSAAMNEAGQLYGQAGRDIVLAQAQGRAVTGEAGRLLTSVAPGAAQAIASFQSVAKEYGASSKELTARSNQSQLEAAASLGNISPVVASTNSGFKKIGETLITVSRNEMAGLTSQKAMEDRDRERERERAQREKSAAAVAAETEKGLKDMGAAIYGMLRPAIEFLTPIVNQLANQFMGFIKDNMPAIRDKLKEVVEAISNFAKNLFSEDGRNKIINDMKYYLGLIFIEIKKAVLPRILYNEADAKKDKDRLDLEKQGNDAKAEGARLAMDNSAKLRALEISKTQGEQEKVEKEINAAKEDVKRLEKQSEKTALTGDEAELLKKQRDYISKNESALELLKNDKEKFNTAEAEKIKAEVDRLKSQGAADIEKSKNYVPQNNPIKSGAVSNEGDAATAVMRPLGVRRSNSQGSAELGGFFSGPNSGYNVTLHGKEIVKPIENNAVSKTELKSSVDSGSSSELKMMQAEIQSLNKRTDTMLQYMREIADSAKKNVDATKSLNRNLFA